MSFTASVLASFVYGWELTLVVLSCAPFIIIATAVVAKVRKSACAQISDAFHLSTSALYAFSFSYNFCMVVFFSK